MEAELDGLHALVPQRDDPVRALARLDQLPGRGVGEQSLGASAEEPPERLPGRLADEVPDRDFERPGAAAVEVDGLAELPDHLGSKRIQPGDEPPEQLCIGHGVAAGPAAQALVGVNADERRVDPLARHGVPGGAEGRIEREGVAPDLDARDFHVPVDGIVPSPADVCRRRSSSTGI